MIKISVDAKPFYEADAQGYVVFCTQDVVLTNPHVKELQQRFYEPLSYAVKDRKFTAKEGTSLVVSGTKGAHPVYIMLYGLGLLSDIEDHKKIERYRRAVGSMIRSAEQLKLPTLSFVMPDVAVCSSNECILAEELMATAMMAHYQFNEFITEEDKKVIKDIEILLSVEERHTKDVKIGIDQGERIGHAVNQARQWCDTPANYLYPASLAEKAERIAATHSLGIKVFDKEQIKKMGMGGIIAVSQGSAREPRLIIMEYKTKTPNAPTIALVGKGITFDTGGLCIKPRANMLTMKDDMAGAAAVIATIEALAHLKPHVNVIAAAACAENMVSGTAGRPSDIITFYNGKTAEVQDTDAEGRLVLADALAYVVKNYSPDMIIDLATLTGSCMVTLGHFFAGLMSKDKELCERIKIASRRSGDRVCELPLDDDFKPALKSTVADLSNIGKRNYYGGPITAALFLSNFVGKTPWAHLDIAGTAFGVPDMSYYREGATGSGVRLMIDLCYHWQQISG